MANGQPHRPCIRDKLWSGERYLLHQQDQDTQPNGLIVWIDWEDKEVLVRYYDDNQTEETFSFEELEDCWTNRFGGMYEVYPTISRKRSTRA